MWTERQRAMLAAIELRVWTRPGAAAAAAAEDADGATPAAVVQPAVAAPPAPPYTLSRPARAASAPAAPAPLPSLPLPQSARGGGGAPRDATIATLDWPALRDAVAGCRACGLAEGRTQTVFGAGHHQAHWMVVGEAPGEQEDRDGEPFVGAAGKLLDRMLAALQLTRAEGSDADGDADGDAGPAQRVYIANTLKCRPPRNRNPAPDELARCAPYLQRQIELLQPRLILAMGRFAVQALLATDEPIGRLRGRVHRAHGVPVVVTYHPAYLLRNLADKARAWDDLCLAAQVAAAAAPRP